MTKAVSDLPRRIALGVLAILALLVLVAGTALIWKRSHLKVEVDGRLRTLREAGLPASGAELDAWYAAVSDSENAALGLTEAFELMGTYRDHRSNEIALFKLPPRGQALDSDQKQLLAGYVELNSTALAKAREAITLPKSRYPVNLKPGALTLLPHLSKVKSLAQAENYEALLALHSGRVSDRVAPITTILGLARSLEQEPILISQLVRVALINIAVGALERSLAFGGFSDTDLSRLGAAFTVSEKTNLMARALIGERAMNIPNFRMSVAEARRLSQIQEEGATPPTEPPLPGRPPFLFRVTGIMDRDLNFFLRAMETNIALASRSPPDSLVIANVADQQAQEAKRKYYILSGLLLPAISRVILREAECLARVRVANVALAVERFRLDNKRLPNDLSELLRPFLPAVPVDPFDGAPLRYRTLPKGYVVYSIGPDGQDDDGKERPEKPSQARTTPHDITMRVEK